MPAESNPQERLRRALIESVPDCDVVAGKICMAAMKRAGLTTDWYDGVCYYVSDTSSTLCFGEVSEDGQVVTNSEASDGRCLRVQDVDTSLDELEHLGPLE
jgi:hypothetical protein